MRSTEAVAVIGCTYRQLDNLTRCGHLPDMNRGSGTRRDWAPEQVVRLVLAYHLATAMPGPRGQSCFPDVALMALSSKQPEPPRRGYVLLTAEPTDVLWVATWADVRNVLQAWGAATVAAYDLDDLVGDRAELAELADA